MINETTTIKPLRSRVLLCWSTGRIIVLKHLLHVHVCIQVLQLIVVSSIPFRWLWVQGHRHWQLQSHLWCLEPWTQPSWGWKKQWLPDSRWCRMWGSHDDCREREREREKDAMSTSVATEQSCPQVCRYVTLKEAFVLCLFNSLSISAIL